MKLVLVSFTLFYSTSYMCISIVSHFTLMFARGTCNVLREALVIILEQKEQQF